jgi:hypothetical protein
LGIRQYQWGTAIYPCVARRLSHCQSKVWGQTYDRKRQEEFIAFLEYLDNWDCQGVYIPNDVTAIALTPDGQNQELTGGVVIKVPKGTNLVLTTNQGTGAVEFNIPVTPVAKAEKVSWYVPKVFQASIDTRPTSAPTNQS